MYCRLTHYQIDPDHGDEMNAVLGDLKWKIRSLPGIVSSSTVWRDDGSGVSMSIYDCRASAVEAAAQLQVIWDRFSNVLAEPPRTEIYDNTQDFLT